MIISLTLQAASSKSSTARPAPAMPAGVSLLHSASFDLSQQRGIALTSQRLELSDTDSICLQLSDGFEWWMSAAELVELFSHPSTSRNADANAAAQATPLECEFDAQRVLRGLASNSSRGQRSSASLSIKRLDYYQFDLAGLSASAIAAWTESQTLHAGQAGLKRLLLNGAQAELALLTSDEAQQLQTAPASEQAYLIFIHGTASSTLGSFGHLWHSGSAEFDGVKNDDVPTAAMQLQRHYGGRSYSFEYATLTQSPIYNALLLAQALPAHAQLHLVSHSQGGLLAELLCCAQLEHADQAAWASMLANSALFFQQDRTGAASWGWAELEDHNKNAYAEQWQYLSQLWQVLRDKQFRITRFVRVACPAMGTTLASGKLDRWLSVLRFSVSLANPAGWGDYLVALICAIIAKRTDPRSLPGIEAMMPGSALIRFLNQPTWQVRADLTVIAGNLEDRSGFAWLSSLISRQFFESRHDLIVNTGSMYGGLRRLPEHGRVMLDVGKTVNHFSYFKNPRTVKALLSALLLPNLHGQSPFSPLLEEQRQEPARSNNTSSARQNMADLPLAILLPGVMGSQLSVAQKRIWLEVLPLVQGDLEKLKYGQPNIKAEDVLTSTYADFIQFIGRSHELKKFPYDWRHSVLHNADLLAQEITQLLPQLESSKRPLRILAHSMGGLVARAMLAQHPELWARLQKLGGFRLIMFGTPNFGSYQSVLMQLGRHQVCNWLALADLAHNKAEVQAIIASFKGSTEMLPMSTERYDFMHPSSWQGLHQFDGEGWQVPSSDDLALAHHTREVLLRAPIDPKTMIYVAGWAQETPSEIVLNRETTLLGSVCHKLRFYSTRRGDGTVVWDKGLLPGIPTYYVEQAEHDKLLSYAPVFPAYQELLLMGSTRLLSTQEPQAARGVDGPDERRLMQIEFPQYLPSLENFGGYGGAPKRGREIATSNAFGPVQVSIRHGDLAYARHPVCVGHYLGDTVVSAERQLDDKLKGVLRERARLGIYPGALGTWAVFIANQAENRPGGAIVIGLGEVGELTPGNLQAGLTAALADYALQVANWHDSRFGSKGSVRHAAISYLLVGTGAGGVSTQDCISALLHSVKSVNDKLTQSNQPSSYINEVEILELFYDAALQAAGALASALHEPELRSYFRWQPAELVSSGTGRFRSHYDADASWWQRTEITFDKKRQELRFVAVTKRARAEQALVAGQMRLAKNFIRQAIGSTSNEKEISRTLFEMLLPNRMKEASPDRQDMVLLLDEESAQFPWEMLEDRWTDANYPPAVAAGMIRQLKTAKFRTNVQSTNSNQVLVVGNPKGCGIANQALIDLPGARHEAIEVKKFFDASRYDVRAAIDVNADHILLALHGAPYRILHLAGHGVHQLEIDVSPHGEDCPCCEQTSLSEKVRMSGMVIGNTVFLSAADIEQMRWVPELVFINCCHLASTQIEGHAALHNELAANLGAQFIRMGVKAVVAAGWEVADNAACAFACTFYQAMLEGEGFGHAVKRARQHIYTSFPEVNTWGAYQCYGDPDYRLVQEGGNATPHQPTPYFSQQELIIDLDNLTQMARFGQVETTDLDKLLQRIPDGSRARWLQSSRVLVALAQAHGELTEFKQALDYLDEAVNMTDGSVSLLMLEDRANFKSRYAQQLLRATPLAGSVDSNISSSTENTALKYFDDAEQELKILLQLGPSSERHYLLASLWKRRATCLPKERLQAFANMREQYTLALKQAKSEGLASTYAKLNLALAEVLEARINHSAPLPEKDILRIVQQCDEIYRIEKVANRDAPDFWSASAMPQSRVIAALARGDLEQQSAAITQLFEHAKQPGASRRRLSSVFDNLQFILAMLTDTITGEAKAEIEALQHLLELVRG